MQNFEAYERPEEYLSAVSRLQEKILKDCDIHYGIGSIGRKELSEAQIADSTDSLDYLWLNDDKGRKRSLLIPPISFRSELIPLIVGQVCDTDKKSCFISFLLQAIGCEIEASREEFIRTVSGMVDEADIRDFSPDLDFLFLAARVSVLLDDFHQAFMNKLQYIPPRLRIEILKLLKATRKADYIFNAHVFLDFLKESLN
ncbi:MAG: hypothetical protein NZT61_05255, partial [Deltaproteobacteria bacterium]|nr:hypothetical protein [Deltaproteobacteria bacterium]